MRTRGRHARLAATAPAVTGLPAIAASYERIDAFLGNLRDRCEAVGDAGERNRVAREQQLNDHAWFVPAWGQLETEIDDACRNAIQPDKSHREWRYRRAWSLFETARGAIGQANINAKEVQFFLLPVPPVSNAATRKWSEWRSPSWQSLSQDLMMLFQHSRTP